MAILSEKRQKCFGLRRKDVRMRAIICDDDGRFAKKLEQLIMQYYRNMGMTIDTTVVTNPQNLLKRNDLANFDIAFLDAYMKPIDGIEVFYTQLGVKLCSMAGGGVQKIYMVFLREPSRRDRSGSDLFHLWDGFEIKMNFDRNVSCFIFVNALMHDDFFD